MLTSGAEIGGYVVEERLGQGGMAAVWRARHVKLGSVHAIKVLLPEFARSAELRLRFLNEGRIQARFRHPALVQVTDLLEEEDVVGLVMDYVPGESLDAVMRRHKPDTLPLSLIREVFLQILAGLGYVHHRGVVHRDLKPSNIMVEETERGPRARVLDFGVAKNDASDQPALTRTGMTLGTLQYMSPEQVRGEAIDPRSDLFSLGVVLYEVLTGRPAFDGSSAWSVQTAIVSGDVVPPQTLRPDLSPAMASIVSRLLQKSPADRFQSCEALADALEQATRPTGAPAWTAPSITPPARASLPGADPSFSVTQEYESLGSEEDDIELAFRPRRKKAVGAVALLVVTVAALVGYQAVSRLQKPSGPDVNTLNDMVRASLRRNWVSGLSFLRLPTGEFRMGCDRKHDGCDPNAPEPHLVRVDGFWMSKTQVTVEAWDRCVEAGACTATARLVVNGNGETCNASDPTKKDHPVNCLTWEESKAVCEWLGGRLPTAAEWEYAAKNGSDSLWPWGGEPPDETRARFLSESGSERRTAAVGTHPHGATAWGLHDLAGNVWEVTNDLYDATKGTVDARGGSFKSTANSLRASNRFEVDPSARSDSLGVRCAFDDRQER